MDALLGTCSLSDLARRKSFKWRTYPADVLPAFVAEMDFTVAEPIADAVREALALGDTGYAHVGELGEAYAQFASDRFGWAPRPDQVFAIPDVTTGIAEVLSAVTEYGSSVVINPPVYGPFFLRISDIGRQVAEVPLRCGADGDYDLDFDALDRAFARPDVSAYLLCSPHNPLGKVWSRADLLTIADLCQARDVALLADEIHGPLTLPGAEFVSFASLDHPMAERAYVFTSASKGWNTAGLKCGIAIAGGQESADVLTRRWDALLASHLGVLASVAAFAKARDWLDAAIARIAANRDELAGLLARTLPGVRYRPGAASFLAWLDCAGLGLGDDPAAIFLNRGRVALSRGLDFGSQGAGFARLNIGTSPELLAEAVRRMTAAVAPDHLVG